MKRRKRDVFLTAGIVTLCAVGLIWPGLASPLVIEESADLAQECRTYLGEDLTGPAGQALATARDSGGDSLGSAIRLLAAYVDPVDPGLRAAAQAVEAGLQQVQSSPQHARVAIQAVESSVLRAVQVCDPYL